MGKKKGVITYISFITPHPGSSFAKKFGNELEILSTESAFKHNLILPLGDSPYKAFIGYALHLRDSIYDIIETIK